MVLRQTTLSHIGSMVLVFQKQEVMDSESASSGFLTHSLRLLTSHLYRGVHHYAIMITPPEHRLNNDIVYQAHGQAYQRESKAAAKL